MSILQSPLVPLAAAAIVFASKRQGSGALAAVLLLFVLRAIWRWWAKLTVIINGVSYKDAFGTDRRAQPFAPSTARDSSSPPKRTRVRSDEGKAGKDGFLTPPGSDDEAEDGESVAGPAGRAEWAPFWPSLPFGGPRPDSPPGAPAASPTAECATYWLDCDGSVFDVRNIRYKQTREKVSSDLALYDCVGMDIVRDRRKIESLIDRLPIDLPASPADAKEWSPAWGIPRVFVVNCQLPYQSGRLIGSHPEDDGGFSVFSYFVLGREACELLANNEETPALRLLRRFTEEGVSTKTGISFKVVGRIEDLDKYEVPESFRRFNNKPVLLTATATVLNHRLPEVLEIDYDVRQWVYPARTALVNYHHRAREAELNIGYLIEGKTDDELPEQILGCFRLVDMDIMAARSVSVM